MLNGKLALHECQDVEALCGKVVSRSGLKLNPDERERLLTYLIETAWELSLRYEAGRGSTVNFSAWCFQILRQRVVDWQRTEFGRGYRPELISYEADTPGQKRHTPNDRITGRMASALEREHLDLAPDRSPDLMRVLGSGGGSTDRGEAELYLAPSEHAA